MNINDIIELDDTRVARKLAITLDQAIALKKAAGSLINLTNYQLEKRQYSDLRGAAIAAGVPPSLFSAVVDALCQRRGFALAAKPRPQHYCKLCCEPKWTHEMSAHTDRLARCKRCHSAVCAKSAPRKIESKIYAGAFHCSAGARCLSQSGGILSLSEYPDHADRRGLQCRKCQSNAQKRSRLKKRLKSARTKIEAAAISERLIETGLERHRAVSLLLETYARIEEMDAQCT